MNKKESRSNVAKYWSIKEKKALYMAMVKHGPDDMGALKKSVPNKTITSIKSLLGIYKTLAEKSLRCDDIDVYKLKPKIITVCIEEKIPNKAPLTLWLNALSKSKHGASVQNLLPEVFSLIGHLETHPSQEENHGVDMKALYLYLASILNGDGPLSLDSKSLEYLNHSLVHLATELKENRRKEEVEFVTNISHIFPDVTISNYSTPIHRISSSNIYNPLNLPVNFLKKYPFKK